METCSSTRPDARCREQEMTIQEITSTLVANEGRCIRVTFDDGDVWTVLVDSVDEEGFPHSGPDGDDPRTLWTRFEGVKLLEPLT